VSNLDHDNRERDLKIAENEAAREFVSDIRLTTWAVSIAVVLCLVALWFWLTR
jgi:hypothetical protein